MSELTPSDSRAAGQRALHVITSTQRRGAEVFAHDLHQVLLGRGASSTLVSLTAGRTPPSIPVPVLGRHRADPRALWRLHRLARRHEVVIAHGSATLLVCTTALAGSGVPLIYRSIGDPDHWRPARGSGLRVGWPLRRARLVVAVWPGGADALERLYQVPPERLRVIPTGVSVDRFPPAGPEARATARGLLGLPVDGPVLAYLGSLTEEKAVQDAMEVVGDRPEVRLVIAGDGPLREQVERRAESLGDRVVVLGAVEDPAQLLAAATALVLPSQTEGLPAVAIEAGLVGRPTAGTDVGGVGSVVVDGETGRLAPAGDLPALADAVDEVLRDAEALGRAARERCLRQFDLERVADQWQELLGEVRE